MDNVILLFLALPFAGAFVLFLIPKKLEIFSSIVFVSVNLTGLACAIYFFVSFFFGNDFYTVISLGRFLPEISIRFYSLSEFLLLAAWGFCGLVGIYSAAAQFRKNNSKLFNIFFLLSGGMASGVLLANDLLFLLFFWEGLLITTFVMIAIGRELAWKTAVKAFIIIGLSDLCMMAGIAITSVLSGTFTISAIALDAAGVAMLAFVLLMIGAIAKAGSMPFHSWIPDASRDAPLPFMAILPASLEKIIGIYFLARVSLDMFRLIPDSALSYTLMIIGCVTILLAVMMALVQKDYKRLLAYHAVSQVGYMVLGIGTCVPVGILGGLFHMINHALYKSGLFLSAGTVEKQAGTTELKELGGLGKRMPATFLFFFICAASISGVPPFNGFFSKEFVYGAALERGLVFYIAAVAGSFFTAASFLKLGHSAFWGKLKDGNANVKEAPLFMLIPLGIIAGFCVLFGLCHQLPVDGVFASVLSRFALDNGHIPGAGHVDLTLAAVTGCVLVLAIANHLLGVWRTKSGTGALDHIAHAPVLASIYRGAEKRYFDPYEWGRSVMRYAALLLSAIDRGFDLTVSGLTARLSMLTGAALRLAHTGHHRSILLWAGLGIIAIAVFIML